jgi:hypothetical protein
MTMKRFVRRALVGTVAAGSMLVPAATASAQPVVTGGLVNITVVDVLSGNQVTLQVPVAVAANICDVDLNVLAADLADDGRATCENDVDQTVESVQRFRGSR